MTGQRIGNEISVETLRHATRMSGSEGLEDKIKSGEILWDSLRLAPFNGGKVVDRSILYRLRHMLFATVDEHNGPFKTSDRLRDLLHNQAMYGRETYMRLNEQSIHDPIFRFLYVDEFGQPNKNTDIIMDISREIADKYLDDLTLSLYPMLESIDLYLAHKNHSSFLNMEHGPRVGNAAAIAVHDENYDHNEILGVKIGGELHDIGKFGIRDDVTYFPGKYNESQMDEMKKHPSVGVDEIRAHRKFIEATRIVKKMPIDIWKIAEGIIGSHHIFLKNPTLDELTEYTKANPNEYPSKGSYGHPDWNYITKEAEPVAVTDMFDSSFRHYNKRVKNRVDAIVEFFKDAGYSDKPGKHFAERPGFIVLKKLPADELKEVYSKLPKLKVA